MVYLANIIPTNTKIFFFFDFCNNLKSRGEASPGLKIGQRQYKLDNPLADIQELTICKSALADVCTCKYSKLLYFAWVIM